MKKDPFTVIYSFKIKEGKAKAFIDAWAALTKLIYEFERSYGSRLHRADDQLFIGYAQWPDKETWKNSGGNLPEEANHFRKIMKDCCSEIKTEFEMDLVKDMLQNEAFKEGYDAS